MLVNERKRTGLLEINDMVWKRMDGGIIGTVPAVVCMRDYRGRRIWTMLWMGLDWGDIQTWISLCYNVYCPKYQRWWYMALSKTMEKSWSFLCRDSRREFLTKVGSFMDGLVTILWYWWRDFAGESEWVRPNTRSWVPGGSMPRTNYQRVTYSNGEEAPSPSVDGRTRILPSAKSVLKTQQANYSQVNSTVIKGSEA